MFTEIRAHSLSGLILLLTIAMTPVAASAFDTLGGDRSNWSGTPDYSIGRLSPNIANQDQIAAIQAAFNAWANVAGTRLTFRQVGGNGGDITVDFLARWPAEFGRYAAGITQTSRRRGSAS